MRLVLLPELRRFAGLPAEPMDPRREGFIIRRQLISAIDRLSGKYEFQGELIPADRMRRAYRLLFKIEGTGQDQAVRRGRAIVVLGLYCTVDRWRRPVTNCPEWDFMLLLAERMTPKPRQKSA